VRRLVAVLLVVLSASAVTGGVRVAAVAPRAKSYAGTVRLTIADLQDYWATELPELYGIEYRRIPAAKIIPYTSTSKVPRCGPGRVRYRDVEGNAFYCNAGKYVAYDDENLFPQLEQDFGDFTIALTLAHEWGHAVQDQAGLTGPTIALEQQADCFAGAWVRHVAGDRHHRLRPSPPARRLCPLGRLRRRGGRRSRVGLRSPSESRVDITRIMGVTGMRSVGTMTPRVPSREAAPVSARDRSRSGVATDARPWPSVR